MNPTEIQIRYESPTPSPRWKSRRLQELQLHQLHQKQFTGMRPKRADTPVVSLEKLYKVNVNIDGYLSSGVHTQLSLLENQLLDGQITTTGDVLIGVQPLDSLGGAVPGVNVDLSTLLSSSSSTEPTTPSSFASAPVASSFWTPSAPSAPKINRTQSIGQLKVGDSCNGLVDLNLLAM